MYYRDMNRTRTTPEGQTTTQRQTTYTPSERGTQTLPPLAPPVVDPGLTGTGTGTGPSFPQPAPIPPSFTQGPPPVMDKLYIPGYLNGLIGRHVRAEFIIGTNQFVDKTGILKEVGVNFFVLHDENFNIDIMCDLYSVKFVSTLR